MDTRGPAALAALALLLFPSFPALGAATQSAPSIGMGFSPDYLPPLSQGTPIFTLGDQMWVVLNFSAPVTVSLRFLNDTSATSTTSLYPQLREQLYLFSEGSPAGAWHLDVTFGGSTSVSSIPVRSQNESVSTSLVAYSISGSNLLQNFTLPPTGADDIQACVIGETLTPEMAFALPGGLGKANVSLAGGKVGANVSAGIEPFSMWQELYGDYSYQTGGGIVSSSLRVAHTDPVLVGGNRVSRSVSPFIASIPLRYGRYTLRSYFRTGSGLLLTEHQYLLSKKAGWQSLDSCTSLSSVNAGAFSVASDLSAPASSWPRSLLTMYGIDGLEEYSNITLPPLGSAINLDPTAAGATLTGVDVSATGTHVRGWGVSGGTAYVIVDQYPAEVTIRLDFGVAAESVNVTVPQAYWRGSAPVPVGTLQVFATAGGGPLPNATFTVSTGQGSKAFPHDSSGRMTAFLPPGNYTVAAAFQGLSGSLNVTVSSGEVTSLSMGLNQPGIPVVLYVSLALAAIGVALNAYVWRGYIRQRRLFR